MGTFAVMAPWTRQAGNFGTNEFWTVQENWEEESNNSSLLRCAQLGRLRADCTRMLPL